MFSRAPQFITRLVTNRRLALSEGLVEKSKITEIRDEIAASDSLCKLG